MPSFVFEMMDKTLVASCWFPRLLALLSLVITAVCQNPSAHSNATQSRQASGYVPFVSGCPIAPLLRPANGLSAAERNYISQRRRKATRALAEWLEHANHGFVLSNLPTLGFVSSGGGYRTMLLSAGVVQAMDSRDSDEEVNGLYQAMTYHSGLSGGAWLLSSIAGNNYATVSDLQEELWAKALVNNSLYPTHTTASPEFPTIQKDIQAKNSSGFSPTITEVWGRFLGHQLLRGANGGIAKRMSSIATSSMFRRFEGPYPIITALGVTNIDGPVCDALDNATQYEIHPYEFGSFDAGVKAFTRTQYLGTAMTNGRPTVPGRCVQNFDNLGFILGTSSSKFNEGCGQTTMSILSAALEPIIQGLHNLTRRDLFGVYPNPFRSYPGSPLLADEPELYLVDGGQALQNNPIWPFLQPARSVDVLIVNDNSADTDDNFPNGTEISRTYIQAKLEGLTKMPFIPDEATFMSKGLTKRASFFGCDQPGKLTIIYLPNNNYTYESNQPSIKMDYERNETAAMIKNGNQIATQNGDPAWPTCLGCGIVSKTGKALPEQCKACFEKYCYRD